MRQLVFLICFIWALPAAALLVGETVSSVKMVDSNGTTHNLTDYRGKVVVLEWTSPVCPYSQYHYATGQMQKMQQAAQDAGHVWLSISSTGPSHPGFMDAAKADDFMKEKGAVPTTLMLDSQGMLAQIFKAKTTPHIAILNKEGVLVYVGAFDSNSAPRASLSRVVNYVEQALNDLAAGQTVQTPLTRPYGCLIKY